MDAREFLSLGMALSTHEKRYLQVQKPYQIVTIDKCEIIRVSELLLWIRRAQSNFDTIFIFVSCGEKGRYRVVLVGQLSFGCRLYCGRARPPLVYKRDRLNFSAPFMVSPVLSFRVFLLISLKHCTIALSAPFFLAL